MVWLIISKLGLQPQNTVFPSLGKDLMVLVLLLKGTILPRYLGSGQCEDIVNLLSFIALNHCN